MMRLLMATHANGTTEMTLKLVTKRRVQCDGKREREGEREVMEEMRRRRGRFDSFELKTKTNKKNIRSEGENGR